MALPTTITDLSVTATSNSPAGTEVPTINTGPDDFIRELSAIIRREQAQFTAVASAATVDLGAIATGNYGHITGTVTITSFGTVAAGIERTVVFDGILTLTHNATSLILRTGANRTTAAGDVAVFVSEGAGNWREKAYHKVETVYQPLDDQLTTLAGITATQATDLAALSTFMGTVLNDADAATARETLGASPSTRAYAEYSVYNGYTGVIPLDDTIPQNTEGDEIVTVSITPKSATSRLRVRVNVGCMTANAALSIIGALFRDATAGALKTVLTELPAAGELSQLQLEHEEASGSTAATTFKFRMGTPGGTYWVNGNSTARLFGGVASVSIIVEEI